ncbi:MAG: mismatch endonuclease, patch repair protein [Chthoniobacter sp.]|nr:mismatch endonuclease, patch repair protein [Chthoniobacter sp.]
MASAVSSLMFSWCGMPGQRCLRMLRQNLSISHWKVISKPARSRPRSNPPIPLKSEAARKRGAATGNLCAPFCADIPLGFPLACSSIIHVHLSREIACRARKWLRLLIFHRVEKWFIMCSMADVFTSTRRSAIMALVRSTGNASTEQRLVRLLRTHRITGWRRGISLPGKPDFIFRAEKVAVFVDGCFWHCCPHHGHMPASRLEYWAPKLARNARRDRVVSRALRASDWMVLRIWECALTRQRSLKTVARISRALAQRRKRQIVTGVS